MSPVWNLFFLWMCVCVSPVCLCLCPFSPASWPAWPVCPVSDISLIPGQNRVQFSAILSSHEDSRFLDSIKIIPFSPLIVNWWSKMVINRQTWIRSIFFMTLMAAASAVENTGMLMRARSRYSPYPCQIAQNLCVVGTLVNLTSRTEAEAVGQ